MTATENWTKLCKIRDRIARKLTSGAAQAVMHAEHSLRQMSAADWRSLARYADAEADALVAESLACKATHRQADSDRVRRDR